MVKKLKENGTGRLPLHLKKRKTDHFTASANDAFAIIRITARDSTEECYGEVLDYLCELLEQEDFPHSYAVEFKGPEKRYLPITGLPKKGINQLCACAVQYPSLHSLLERYARLAMRQYEQYTNLSDEQCALPGSFAVFALGMLGQEWRQLVWDYFDLCDDEHSRLQEKFLREYVKQFGFTADTVSIFVRGLLVHAEHEVFQGLCRLDGKCRKPGRSAGGKSPIWPRSFPAVFPPTRMTMMTRMRNPPGKQKPARRKCCNTHGRQSAM